MSSDHSRAKKQQASQIRKKESEHSQQDSNQQTTENMSSKIQSASQEKTMFVTQAVKATPHSETIQRYSNTNGQERVNSNGKERGKASETLNATNSPSENSNVSVEEQTMQNLAEARLALNRLKSIIETVSRVRESASSTVGVTEGRGSKSDSDSDSENKDETVSDQGKSSSIKSTPISDERESQVKRVGNPGRMGRRGESGLKILKREKDAAKTVITEKTNIPRQKGESTLMSKNGPGFKLDKIASKNTRELSNAELLFEEGSRPIGPKHTPPLESKRMLVQAKNCGNIGRKKSKGEAYAMNCLTQDSSTQSLTTESDEGIQQSVSKTEFSKAATKERSETTGSSFVQSDAEANLMKQTSADKISTTPVSNANVSDLTSEATVVEKSEMKTSDAKDVNSETINKERDSVKENIEVATETKVVEQDKMKTAAEDVVNDKTSDKEGLTQHEQMMSSGSKTSDAKVDEKSQVKLSSVEDVVDSKPSHEKSENFKDVRRSSASDGKNSHDEEREKSEMKTSTSKSSDKKGETSKQRDRATTTGGKTYEQRSKGQKATTKVNPEQKNAEFKSSKAFNSDKASQNIKDRVKEAEYLHRIGAGSSVFETSFMNVHTGGSVQELNDGECRHIEGIQALVIRNKQFSAWLSLDTKNIE